MITKVYDHRGQEVHNCEEAGCSVSWDGYILDADRFHAEFTDEERSRLNIEGLAHGDRVPQAVDPGDEWDTTQKGIARAR